jgi:protein-S-isoprenylcysteine O-methyltransferase Ste14
MGQTLEFVWFIKCLGLINLIGFTWAAIFHFKHPEAIDYRKTLLSLSATFATGFNSYLLATVPFDKIHNTALVLFLFPLSFFIFVWALSVSAKKLDFAFSKSTPSELLQSGPYKFMRHPFYMSYSLTWLACFTLTLNILSGILVVWMGFLYFIAARYEERTILRGELSKNYLEYKSSVGVFIPKKFPFRKAS